MCIICREFQKFGDLGDARKMLEKAKTEPKSGVDPEHLKEVEAMLDDAEKSG